MDKDALNEPFDGDGDERENSGPDYRTVERILRLLHLLSMNACTQQDIFERLRDYYPVDTSSSSSSRAAYGMLRRDLQFMTRMGYEVRREETRGVIRFSLAKGTGPVVPIFFQQEEVAILAMLYALFLAPNALSAVNLKQPLASQVSASIRARYPVAR